MDLGRRIMVLGSAGSGKSMLSIKLGEITGLPVVHIDRLSWNPGWVATPNEELDKRVIEAASGENWIIDGNYGRTLGFRMERADSIIYLDFNRYFCVYRILKRKIRYHGKTRYDLGEGCPERMDWAFIKWVWDYPKRARKNMLDKIYGSGKPVYHLKSRKEVRDFIEAAAGC